MTVLPVIERELRTQARLGFTYLVRVLGATALICACFWFGIVNGFTPKVGPYLFGCLNTTLVVAIWIFAPLICADCISRERREGTVGLLFLTPLKAREIVLAKGLVHGLRSMTLLLAVLPVMTISFLVGGVTWRQALLSGLVNFSCICWALAAGLLASSISKSWLRSMLLSFGLAGCFSVALMIFTGWRVIYAVRSDPAFILPFPYYGWRLQNAMNYNYLQAALPVGFFSITDLENFWGIMFGSLTHSTQRAWLREECEVAIISVMVLVVAVLIAAWNLRRRWQEEPPSARRLWMQEKFCTPVVGVGFFHRWLRRKLERNPIGWLEQRKWTGRLVTWGWLAVMISFYSAVLSAPNAWGLLGMVQGLLAWMLVGIMASSASGSFQRERESRVLELLLVSPMSAGQIISGRLRGLWGQFVPTFALLLFVWWILQEGAWPRRDFNFSMIPYFCGAFLTLPVIGLYYSLLRKHFISSFLWTLWMGVLLPFVLKWVLLQSAGFVQALIANFFPSSQEFMPELYMSLVRTLSSPEFVPVIQLAIAVLLGWRLHDNLANRKFAFSSATD